MGIVAGSVGGVPALLAAWFVPVALWTPSSLIQAKVLFAQHPDDPRAVELADGRVISRRDFSLWMGARAWEGATIGIMPPVLALGFWLFSPLAALVLAGLLAMLPPLMIRHHWYALKLGHAIVALASERTEQAEALLLSVIRARFLSPTVHAFGQMLLARAIARQGRVQEASDLLAQTREMRQSAALDAQLRIALGDLEPARTLLAEGDLPPGFSGELSRAFLEGLLHLHTGDDDALVVSAESWADLQERTSEHTARLLDLIHAAGLWRLGRREDADHVFTRRGAHTDDWPWLEPLYPTLAALRDELAQARG
ncbi:MAG: hypothetical protein KC912_01005 [Proteobacteria bacterium]|nr:hypothetical protein [Pseudomonadota bacterium]